MALRIENTGEQISKTSKRMVEKIDSTSEQLGIKRMRNKCSNKGKV